MSALTLEAAQAQIDKAQASVDEAKAILEKMKAQPVTSVLKIAGIEIALQPGEHYGGPVLARDGTVKHHLVLMDARPSEDLGWQAAKEWAASVGGSLPDRQEQALLFANCKPHLAEVWHWSSQEHETNASYAWYCYFSYGSQYYNRKSAEGAAVAVRRVNS